MFDDEVEYPMSVVDCVISANKVQHNLNQKTTENLINFLIDLESRMGVELPDDLASIIDDFYNTPDFPPQHRKAIMGFLTLLKSELMISEDGHVMRTMFV